MQAASSAQQLQQSGDALAVYNTILPLSADDARAAFDALSGEAHASFRLAVAEGADLFQSTLARRSGALFGEASGISGRIIDGVSMWATVLDKGGGLDADGNAAELEHRFSGLAFGAEGGAAIMGGTVTAGAAAGFLDGAGSTDGRMSAADISSWHLGVYSAWDHDALHISGALSYASAEIDSARIIAWPGLLRVARAGRDAETFGATLEAAYRLPLGTQGFSLAPLAVVDYLGGRGEAMQETGAGAANLSVAGQNYDRLEAGAGLAAGYSFEIGGRALLLDLRGVYRSRLSDEGSGQTMALAGAPNAVYSISAPHVDRDRVILGAGLSGSLTERLWISARYDGSLSGSAHAHQMSLSLGWTF